MKKLIGWTISALVLMIGFPWLTAAFAGSAGMAICLVLFFAVNPLFSVASGVFAGRDVKRMWMLPIVTAGLYILGTWMFFDMGETAFLLYGGIYLVLGLAAMLFSKFIGSRKQR